MSAWATLHPLRIGCVQYLNAKPLIGAYDGATAFAHPSELSRMLERGDLDVALIPVFDALRHPEYALVEGVAIASRGPVYSVVLAWQGSLARVKTISLDPASRTSAHLVQVLLAEYYGMRPRIVPAGESADAQLWIGTQAIEFRRANPDTYYYMDLGEEWRVRTGLPAVFAAWSVRPDAARPEIGEALRALATAGKERVSEIAAQEPDPDFARRYLTDFLSYDLGAEEKQSLHRYAELLTRHIEPVQSLNRWI